MSLIADIDDLDKDIISILVNDAKTPYTDIAKRLIVSPGTIHVRMKKLEQLGVVQGCPSGRRTRKVVRLCVVTKGEHWG